MLFDKMTFIGIDPTAGERPFVYAAIDHDLKLLALGGGGMEDILAFAAGQQFTITAVCAPRQPNLGLMARSEIRQSLSPVPNPGRWENFRIADYLLRQHNISIPRTAAKEEDCPNWMRNGFTLYKRLESLGYRLVYDEGAECQCMEVYPYASYTVLLGLLPFPKYTLEGRLQRQLILNEKGLNVVDPMRIFEEITRHRMLHGVLPLDDLYSPGELDALVAAYTAWMVGNQPEQVTMLGDVDEGQIVLPTAEFKQKY